MSAPRGARDSTWRRVLGRLLRRYGARAHPLEARSPYQLVVMVVLSAQTTDALVNRIAPSFFAAYPTFGDLARARPEDLFPLLRPVRNFANKARWLVEIAKAVGDEARLPRTIEGLTRLPGIGRKSANLILRELGETAEGVIVDLHVARVSRRLGLVDSDDAERIERCWMQKAPRRQWGDLGMALSFLGREVCRPTAPRCPDCDLKEVCAYAAEHAYEPSPKRLRSRRLGRGRSAAEGR